MQQTIINQELPFKYDASQLSSLTDDKSTIGDLFSSGPRDFTYNPSRGTKAISNINGHKYMMESNNTIAEFQQQFTGVRGFSVAICLISASDFYGAAQPFMTLGETEYNPYRLQKCQGFDFRLLQLGPLLYASFFDSLAICEQLLVGRVPLSRQLTHLVSTFGNSSMQIYMDVHAVYPNGLLDKRLT